MLSQTTEYALRAVVFLAYKAPAPQTTDEIAAVTRVPGAYLAKVLQGLSRAGLVNSQRGIRGGFSLARDPETLTLLEVIHSVDPIRRILSCPLQIAGHGAQLCPLHRRLDDAIARVEEAFGSTTVADVIAGAGGTRPLCEFPAVARSGDSR